MDNLAAQNIAKAKTCNGVKGERTLLEALKFHLTSLLFSFLFLFPNSTSSQVLSSLLEINHISGKNIINFPNRNSSSGVPNMPFVEIPKNQLVGIGHICERDSDCGNSSVCILELREDDTARKLCDCDINEMIKLNHTCYIKPGHQCYFPNMNSHGYRFVECFPGSTCTRAVNASMPDNGYCMCDLSRPNAKFRSKRNLNKNFEMSKCKGSRRSTYSSVFYSVVLFLSILLIQ